MANRCIFECEYLNDFPCERWPYICPFVDEGAYEEALRNASNNK